MAGTQWIRPEESLASASSLNCGTLIQLCGRQMAHALQSESVAEFLSSEAPELATELAVQWLAVVKRIPGPAWETVGAHGRHSLPKLPTQFWDESQERESAGQMELDGGWTAFAVGPQYYDSGTFGWRPIGRPDSQSR